MRLDDRWLEVVELCEACLDGGGHLQCLPSCLSGLEVLDCGLVLHHAHAVVNEVCGLWVVCVSSSSSALTPTCLCLCLFNLARGSGSLWLCWLICSCFDHFVLLKMRFFDLLVFI